MNKTTANKYVLAIKKFKAKYLTIEQLSHEIGYYSEVIAKDLAEFEPMINFDPNINIKDLLPKLEDYISSLSNVNKKPVVKKSNTTTSKEETYQSYIFSKMTLPGGLIDKNRVLSPTELKTLRRLINLEIKRTTTKK